MVGARGDASEALIPGFALEKALGKGGFATAYLAKDLTLKLYRVIKVLNAALVHAKEDDYVSLFLQEAQALAAINDVNVARILMFGTTTDGRPYFVMEHLPGSDLATVIKEQRGKPIEILHAVKISIQIFEGLMAAHDAGIVHRDIKPDNIFIAALAMGRNAGRGELALKVKLIDFGTFSVAGTTEVRRGSAVFRGTPWYAAPEAFEGERATPAWDIYSAGCVLYELLTGKPPFGHIKPGDYDRLEIAHREEEPPPLLSLRPDVPEALVRLVECLLAKDPGVRARRADWVARQLRDLQDDLDRVATETHAITARNIEVRRESLTKDIGGPVISSPRFVDDNRTDVDGALFEDLMREVAELEARNREPEVLSDKEYEQLFDLSKCEPEDRGPSTPTIDLSGTVALDGSVPKLTHSMERTVTITSDLALPAKTRSLSLQDVPPPPRPYRAPAPIASPPAPPATPRDASPEVDAPDRGSATMDEAAWYEAVVPAAAPNAPLDVPPPVVRQRVGSKTNGWRRHVIAKAPALVFVGCIAAGLMVASSMWTSKPASSEEPAVPASIDVAGGSASAAPSAESSSIGESAGPAPIATLARPPERLAPRPADSRDASRATLRTPPTAPKPTTVASAASEPPIVFLDNSHLWSSHADRAPTPRASAVAPRTTRPASSAAPASSAQDEYMREFR